ncbi:hypothetical protein V8C42DRAFT_304540 [Trichoderma barbatum]
MLQLTLCVCLCQCLMEMVGGHGIHTPTYDSVLQLKRWPSAPFPVKARHHLSALYGSMMHTIDSVPETRGREQDLFTLVCTGSYMASTSTVVPAARPTLALLRC